MALFMTPYVTAGMSLWRKNDSISTTSSLYSRNTILKNYCIKADSAACSAVTSIITICSPLGLIDSSYVNSTNRFVESESYISNISIIQDDVFFSVGQHPTPALQGGTQQSHENLR